MKIRIQKIEGQEGDRGTTGKSSTYRVVDDGQEFLINYVSHPHHGASLSLAGQGGTLHIRAEDNRVVRQVVALGGGCALAIHEDLVEGLSPASLRAVMIAEQTDETGEIAIDADESETDPQKA